ncbi:hypothetical protein O988_01321 [Pseudogymnoascus sp. VKM F-3808]|nr:hypothetical protein O988_01321 [Pseudogymnoascus sp. VKM F-3808]
MASQTATTVTSRHITLPFNLRADPLALNDPKNRELLYKLFPGTTGLAMDGTFLYIIQAEAPPKPWPKSIAGLPSYFAPQIGPQHTPVLFGWHLGRGSGAIARSLNGRDMADWEPLFIIVKNHFKVMGVSVTEIMYWGNYLVVILEHRRTADISKLPWKAGNIAVTYFYEDEVGRPSTPQSRCEAGPRPGNQVDLKSLTPAKRRRTRDFVFLGSSDRDSIEGSFMGTSFQRVIADEGSSEQQWVFAIWLYMGQDSADALPSRIYGNAIFTSTGYVLGFCQYAPTEGPMKDWCVGIATNEFIDRGFTNF